MLRYAAEPLTVSRSAVVAAKRAGFAREGGEPAPALAVAAAEAEAVAGAGEEADAGPAQALSEGDDGVQQQTVLGGELVGPAPAGLAAQAALLGA